MSGRDDFYRFEPPPLLRGLSGVGRNLRSAFVALEGPITGFRQPLSCLVPGDPKIARDIYRGRIRLANRSLEGRFQWFLSTPVDPVISDALLSLSWLPHLAAADLALYRGFTRNLFSLCAKQCPFSSSLLSRRLMLLSRFGDFLLAGAPVTFVRSFLGTVSWETRALKARRIGTDEDDLCRWLSLLAVSLSFRGAEDLRKVAMDRAAAAIPGVVMADGGHVSRNPQKLLELLLDLIPLVDAMRAYRIAVPGAFDEAIARACPMLRMMCHEDGGLALFQGVDNSSHSSISAILRPEPGVADAGTTDMRGGYARLTRAKSTVIMDVGGTGEYNSALSFEFSHGLARIVSNCGTPAWAAAAWRAAASSASAHSGLQVDHRHRPNFPFFRRSLSRAPDGIAAAAVTEIETGVMAGASRACGASQRGLQHSRQLYLTDCGNCLEGEDRLDLSAPSGGDTAFTMRFHLDPGVKAFSSRGGSAINLMLANRAVWQFSVHGAKAMLEESVLMAGEDGIRKTQQIVLRGTSTKCTAINWAFRRMEKPVRPAGPGENTPHLPF